MKRLKILVKRLPDFVRASGEIDYRFIWRINIEQIDGNVDDENYWETNHSWKTELVGTVSQTFLYVHLIIEISDLSEENKANEKTNILEARKSQSEPNCRDLKLNNQKTFQQFSRGSPFSAKNENIWVVGQSYLKTLLPSFIVNLHQHYLLY